MSDATIVHRDEDEITNGHSGTSRTPSRSGFVPIPLVHLTPASVSDLPVYLQKPGRRPRHRSSYTLYRSPQVPFTAEDRSRLLDSGVRFVYIRMSDQERLRQQTENAMVATTPETEMPPPDTSAIIYEATIELVNELLAEPSLEKYSARLDSVARSVATVVLRDQRAFAHIFATSHHDFYTATHLVNVGLWMVPLAYDFGVRTHEDLSIVCLAGLMHDIGKIHLPPSLIQKSGKFTDADRNMIRQHPARGWAHLSNRPGIPERVAIVARQHHERLDGSGYPYGLVGESIAPLSRMCAIVDVFDALTAVRPYRDRPMTVSEAIIHLKKETPTRLDSKIVEAWIGLLQTVDDEDLTPATLEGEDDPLENTDGMPNRRRNQRFTCNCPAELHLLRRQSNGKWEEGQGMPVTLHSVSRFGVGVLSPEPIDPATTVRIYLTGPGWTGRRLFGQAIRCRSYGDGWHEVGIELTPPKRPGGAIRA